VRRGVPIVCDTQNADAIKRFVNSASPLTIGVHDEAIGVDGGNRSDMHY
jgi:hypothetical protein